MKSSQDLGEELVELQRALYISKNPTRRWLHCLRRDWVIAELRESANMLDNAMLALEIGPGSGVYLPELCRLFGNVIASDIQTAHLNALEPMSATQHNLQLVMDDISETLLPKEQFDLILCSEVIEHIPTTCGVLAGIFSLLRPGGILIITTPQKYSTLEMCAKAAFLPIIIDVVRAIYAEPIEETGHINLMTAPMMENALNEAGFVITKRHKLGLYLPVIAEFLGVRGAKMLKRTQEKIRDTPLDFALWTQCYVAKKRAGP